MIKKIIVYSCIFAALLLNATSTQAQEVKDNSSHATSQDSTEQKVLDVVEQMPSFPGGPSRLFTYLSKNIKYPVEAEKNGIQGRVIVTFIVERDGAINDVTVAKSVDQNLDREAVRVVKSMPNWIPGKQDGKNVRVKYTVPITFRLTGKNRKNTSTQLQDSTEDNSFSVSEQMPSFVGGSNRMFQYITKNTKYPSQAKKKGIQGRVIITFAVEKDGSISDIKVAKSVDPDLDNETIRLVKNMPKWNSGKLNGVPIRSTYTLPVLFRLPKSTKRIEAKSDYSETKVFDDVEETHTLFGEPKYLCNYILKNLKYPAHAGEKDIHGEIILSFIVERDGNISDVSIEKSLDPVFDNEAIRIVYNMPRWIPQKLNKKNIRVKFTIPITFSMQSISKKENKKWTGKPLIPWNKTR